MRPSFQTHGFSEFSQYRAKFFPKPAENWRSDYPEVTSVYPKVQGSDTACMLVIP